MLLFLRSFPFEHDSKYKLVPLWRDRRPLTVINHDNRSSQTDPLVEKEVWMARINQLQIKASFTFKRIV